MENGPAPTTLGAARVTVSVLGGLLILVEGFLSLVLFAFSTECTKYGDSYCVEWIWEALAPGVIAIPCAIIAIVIAYRTRSPSTAWGAGLGLQLISVLLFLVLLFNMNTAPR